MAESQYYNKRKLTLDPVNWTSVVPPIDCRHIIIRNTAAVAIKIRTDATNANSEDTINAGVQDSIQATLPIFSAGLAAFALLSSSGAPTVVITFIR